MEIPWLPCEKSLCTLEMKGRLFISTCPDGANAQGRVASDRRSDKLTYSLGLCILHELSSLSRF